MTSASELVQQWQAWIQQNSGQVIGGDVEESRRGVSLRGPIISIEMRATNLTITTEWTAIDTGDGWRHNMTRRSNANVFTFDVRGTKTATDDPQRGVMQVASGLVTLTIYMTSSRNKLNKSDVR